MFREPGGGLEWIVYPENRDDEVRKVQESMEKPDCTVLYLTAVTGWT